MQKIDYTTLSGAQNQSGEVYNKRWWLAPKDERAQAVAQIVNMLHEYDTKRQTQYQISTRLYGNSNLMGINGMSFSKMASVQSQQKERVTYNVTQSVIDTITAKMVKNKPKPLFLTSGGDQKLQRKAKKLDKFIDGVFYHNEAYSLGRTAFRDACVLGDGVIHVYPHNGQICYERIIPSELYIDWVEAFYGNPRQLHRVKIIDREVLIDIFPNKKEKILEANSASESITGIFQNVADMVTVVESWHLPSGKGASDGVHSINIANANLLDEKYEKSKFPFAKLSWCPRLYGYWAQGLAEQVQPFQLEINKILWVIQRSMHLAGSFKIAIENTSKIVKEHLNNEIGTIISYAQNPPQYLVPPIVPPEVYQHLMTLKNAAFERAGVSQLSASSQKPAGLNSGKALREYNDIETERFMTIGLDYQKFFLDLADLSIDAARDIFTEDKNFSVKVPGKTFIETIPWKEVDLSEDQYIMKMFPVSSLPSDPAGRLQTVQEYAQAGYMSPRTARKLLDFPDLEQVEDLANSEEEYLNQILEKIVDDGDYTPPEPFDDLQLAKQLALEYYAQGKINNLEEDKLEMLRTFMSQIDLLVQKSMPPPPPPMMGPNSGGPAPGGPPPANPMAPPTSDLLPNING